MRRRNDARQYRLRAQHCLDIANDLTGARKLVLIEMAQAWARLADQSERNQKSDLVYETPSSRKAPILHPRPAPSEPQPNPTQAASDGGRASETRPRPSAPRSDPIDLP